jgi:hypothetical protein
VYHQLPEETVAGLFRDKREPLQSGRAGAPDLPMHLNRQPSRAIIHAHAIAMGKEATEEAIPTGDRRIKVGSFYENIAEPDTSPHTTVDFRAHDIAAGRLLSTGTDRELRNKSLLQHDRRGPRAGRGSVRLADLLAQHAGLRLGLAAAEPVDQLAAP